MVKFSLKLYASNAASADAIASVIIPQSSQLVGVAWDLATTVSGAAGGGATWQLSTQSTGQFALNDARGIVDEFSYSSDCITSATNCGGNAQRLIQGWKFNSGEKLYLHLSVKQAFGTTQLNCLVHFA